MKRIILSAVALATVFLTAAPAQAQWYPGTRAPTLEAKLPTPMAVYCTTNTGGGFVSIGTPEIYLGVDECNKLLSEQPSLDGHGGFPWAMSAFVLYHEWWHLAFSEYDEKLTDTGALTVLRYMLRTYWGMSEREAQHHYDAVAGYTHYMGPSYKPNSFDPVLPQDLR